MIGILKELTDFASQLDSIGLTKEADTVDRIIVLAQELPTSEKETEIRSPITERWGEETWEETEDIPADLMLAGDSATSLEEHPMVNELEPFIRKVYARCMRDHQMQQHTTDIQRATKQRGWDAGLELQRQLVPDVDIVLPLAHETTITPTVGGEGVSLTIKELQDVAMRAADFNAMFEEVGVVAVKNDEQEKPLHPSQFYNIVKTALHKFVLKDRGAIAKPLAQCMAEWALDPVAIYADYYKEEFDNRFVTGEVENYYMPQLTEYLSGG